LAYGRNDLQPAQYDLALLAPRVMGAPAVEVGTAAAPVATSISVTTLVSPRAFWVIIGVAVLVLLALIARLLKASDSDQRAS
jgi:predicted cobalt transporter CbtA